MTTARRHPVAISFHGNTAKDWSADYQTFSRSPGEPRDLFAPILQEAIQQHGLERMVVSVDDPREWRPGHQVPGAQLQRDPLGPAGHTNRRRGLRCLPAALILPLYTKHLASSARSLPARWELAPVVKKPGKNASAAELTPYRRERKRKHLARQFVRTVQELRQHRNPTAHAAQPVLIAADGSCCNRTVLAPDWQT